MRILLVRPHFHAPDIDAPLSLAILGRIAQNLGHYVKIVDLNLQSMPENTESFDIVGITGYSSMKDRVLEIARKYESAKVIVGGPWAIYNPEEVLESGLVDYVCMTEGEQVWHDFLQSYPAVQDVKGLGSKEKLNPLPKLITDLDSLPFPAWELVKDLSSYAKVPVISSRGCPYRCCFCNAFKFYGRKWRARSAVSVIDELEWLVNNHHVKYVTFADDNATWDVERFRQICRGIISRGIKLIFDTDTGTRVDRLPEDLITLMAQAGCKRIQLNPESGVQRVLDEIIHKSLDLKYLFPTVEKCLKEGISVQVCFVIGFPNETWTEVLETVRVGHRLRKLGCSVYVGNAMPYPDTDLYNEAKANGSLRFDGKELDDIVSRFARVRSIHCLSSPYWKPEWIIKMHREECRADVKTTFKRFMFSRKAWSKALKEPMFVLQKVKGLLI